MPDEIASPNWWVKRLEQKLTERRLYVDLMSRYYSGDHPLPIAHDRLKSAFRRLLVSSRANWMGMVVDAVAERLHVVGFRLDQDEQADSDSWMMWQRNELDAASRLVHDEALVCGTSYVSVWANPKDPETPSIRPEHPSQMITDTVPGNSREVAAALKIWEDDWTGDIHATLYLPDGIWKFKKRGKEGSRWLEREPELANPLGVVPVVPFLNRPRLLTGGRSEIEDITPIQDRVNKTLFDRLMASEYSAFRQRWATGMEIPVDEDDNPIEPFKAAVDRLWISEDPLTKFGEFEATDLEPYIKAVESDVNAMAAISRTPPHYLLGAMVNISGDALKAAESGLSSKAASKTRHFGESWERVISLAFAVLEDPRAKVSDSQTIWQDVETRTEGERVDALVKMSSLGVPRTALWERWGASPQEIAKWQDQAFEEQLTAQAVNASGLAPNQPPPAPVPAGTA